MVDERESILLQIVEYFSKPERQVWDLLDDAYKIVISGLKERNEKSTKTRIRIWGEKCCEAENFLEQELSDNPYIDAGIRSTFLKDFEQFLGDIRRWIDSAFTKGKASFFEYEALKLKRHTLFLLLISYLKEQVKKYEHKIKQLQPKLETPCERKPAETGQETKAGKKQNVSDKGGGNELKNRFEFNPGQVKFSGNDLGLGGMAVILLKKFFDEWGRTVTRTEIGNDFDLSLSPSSYGHTVTRIRKVFVKEGVPCEIAPVTGEGWVLRGKAKPKKKPKGTKSKKARRKRRS